MTIHRLEQADMSGCEALFERALQHLPGGVSRDTVLRSPHPLYAARGRGYVVTDVDGRGYLDFSNNMASLIHGHAFAPIVEAVTRQLQLGTCFTFGTEAEIVFAEHLCSRSPSFDMIRFMNSGTEAVMATIKAARAYTGRPRIAKVEGAYHGAYDYVEVSQMPGPDRWGRPEAPNPVPLAAGTPPAVAEDVVVIPFNAPQTAIEILDRHAGSIAGVLVDPLPHRVGLIPAAADYLRALHDWAHANGALLLFDEVITFRTEVGGAQSRYDVRPDLTALGKMIGGGFPVGAVAGRRDVMAVFASGEKGLRLPQSGTFSANPITMTAGLVAMQHFDKDAVARLNRLGDRVREGLAQAIDESGIRACVTGAGSLFRVHLRAAAPRNYRAAYLDDADKKRLGQFVNGMLERGIILTNTGTGMLSTAMAETQVDQLQDAAHATLLSLPR
jgi:glutamate-1-semialdehyde 2,1-aminomutase